MELILDFIYLYIGIFSLYFFVLGIRSLNERKLSKYERYCDTVEQSRFCIVLYSHDEYDSLKNMLNQLNSQNYPADRYFIQVILDNCSDHSEDLIHESPNLRILNLNDGVTVGRDQAVSILLESMRENTSFDSYAFVDINRYIEQDFLSKANYALTVSPIVTGQNVILENENHTFSEKIKIAYHKFINNFIRKSRFLLGLADKIDSSVMFVKKDFVEKVDALDIKNINTELKYSVLTADLGYPCLYVPTLKVYVKYYNFVSERPSLSYRISLFKNCFTKLFTFNFKFTEFVCSLIAPSGLVVLILSILFLLLSAKYYFLFNFVFVFTLFSLLSLGFAIGYIKSGLHAKDFIYLAIYPLYSIIHIIDNLPPYRFIKKYFINNEDNNKNIQKYTVKVVATNGKSNIPCNLDLISEDGLAKVVFSFKKKKFTSSKQLRMVEALNELTSKLNDYGFHLKICYCCEYFSSIVDGSQNMVQGECSYDFKNKNPDDILKTLLWNSCSAYKHKQITSVFDEINLDNSDK